MEKVFQTAEVTNKNSVTVRATGNFLLCRYEGGYSHGFDAVATGSYLLCVILIAGRQYRFRPHHLQMTLQSNSRSRAEASASRFPNFRRYFHRHCPSVGRATRWAFPDIDALSSAEVWQTVKWCYEGCNLETRRNINRLIPLSWHQITLFRRPYHFCYTRQPG